MSALYSGTSGMKTHEAGIGIVSNNIANMNTISFKQDNFYFQDLMYKNLTSGQSDFGLSNQLGMGSTSVAARTLFSQGALESSTNSTDLAIAGSGYFKVTGTNGNEYLTRAGNFFFDNTGTLGDAYGSSLMGYPIDMYTGATSTTLQPVQLDLTGSSLYSPAIATSSIAATFNLALTTSTYDTYETVTVAAPTEDDPDATEEVTQLVNPYFSLLNAYDATTGNPLSGAAYSHTITVYDDTGAAHELTLHFDIATDSYGQKVIEYTVSIPASEDGRDGMVNEDGTYNEKAGLLMAGTLTFSSAGQLTNMSAFTPTEGSDLSDLSSWTPSALDADGYPVMSVSFAGASTQNIKLDLGATAPGGWTNGNITAADVGSMSANLPSMGTSIELTSTASTAYAGTSSLYYQSQNGAMEGYLSGINVATDGTVQGYFSNGQTHDLYQIPIFRVTNESGLMKEGGNYYTVTDDCGLEESGVAGTENYGQVASSAIEGSNVDLSTQMVNLIILQRGFQSNSKTITTADTMLQKALEIKK